MCPSNANPRRALTLVATVGACLLVVGCVSTEERVPPAAFSVTAEHFAGSVYTGPLAESPELDAVPWFVELTVAYLAAAPEDPGEPLTSRTRQVFLEGTDEPLRTRGELARGVMVAAAGDELAPTGWRQDKTEAIWPGTTVSLRLTSDPAFAGESLALWEELSVEVSRPRGSGDVLEVALCFQGPRPLESENVREHVVLEAPDLDRGLRIIVPAPRAENEAAFGVLELTRAPAGSVAVTERGRNAVEAALRRVARESEPLNDDAAFVFERSRALEALDGDSLQRPALLFLADHSGAEASGEVALVADDETLAAFIAQLRGRLEAAAEEDVEGVDAFGWFLERTTYMWLSSLAAAPEAELAPELASLMLRLAGELGRYPDLLSETVAECRALEGLRLRLLQENRIFLEDSRPSARVRAYDWLAFQGLAPAGYDPLASRDERRAALAALEEDTP